jgi:hypothetical protein
MYEDLIRTLMGSDAYLLFVFDNLIKHVSIYFLPNVCIDFTILKTLPKRRLMRYVSKSVQEAA